MASASVCFLNRVSGLSAAGLMLEGAASEIRLDPLVGVGSPDRKCELLGVVGIPDDMVSASAHNEDRRVQRAVFDGGGDASTSNALPF